MRSKIITFGLILVLLFSGTVSTAQAGDWPMFHHDLRHTGYVDDTISDDLELLWSYTTGAGVYSSPAVAAGKVFVGSYYNKIYCFGQLHPKSQCKPR